MVIYKCDRCGKTIDESVYNIDNKNEYCYDCFLELEKVRKTPTLLRNVKLEYGLDLFVKILDLQNLTLDTIVTPDYNNDDNNYLKNDERCITYLSNFISMHDTIKFIETMKNLKPYIYYIIENEKFIPFDEYFESQSIKVVYENNKYYLFEIL